MTGTIPLSYLLDSVAVIARFNEDEAVIRLLNAGASVSVPVIVLGELYAGAENSSRVEANIEKIDRFARGASVLLCDEQTAREYARIAQQLRRKGHPIPQNDMWIAALAIQHGLTLVTRDAHFEQIDGLNLQAW